MRTPKIIFTYSLTYDQNCKEWTKLFLKKRVKYPSSRKVISYTKEVKTLWKKYEKRILEELSRITGLKWKEDEIPCYVVGRIIPFSDPLTLPFYEKHPDYFIDVLVHELIHQLFTQNGNLKRSEKAWKFINRKYKKESRNTRIHIPVHAFHSHIYLKFFDENRLRRDINLIKSAPDYIKSWELVKKTGYKKIIDEFSKRIGKK